MQRGFGGTAFEPVEEQEQRDTEITIGPTMLTALVIALLALCGLSFVMGYAVGHSGSNTAQTALAPTGSAPVAVQSAVAQPKPSAAQNNFEPQPQAAPDGSTTEAATDAAPSESGQSSESAAASTAQPAIRQALVSQPAAQQQVTGASVQQALPSSSALMVQIAAVSHPEDAEVLVGALRKRGYTVAVRRDPTDSLLHVQIGPFTNRSDATAMRLKLLNDGYNAIIQP